MKTPTSRFLTCLVILNLPVIALQAEDDDVDQTQFPAIVRQPTDDAIRAGGSTTFSVQATNDNLRFQWYRNGHAIQGETNATLRLENVQPNDAAYYSADIFRGSEVVPTRSASLNVFTENGGGSFTVFGSPFVMSGGSGLCPGPYAGYVNYTKPYNQGWGWAPSTNTSLHIASDGTGRLDTKVQYGGKFGDVGCGLTSVIVTPTISPKYRFTIYFPNNVPTNAYPITLDGFDP